MFAYLLRATVNKADLVEVRNAYKTPVCNLWILVCCKTVSSTCRQSKWQCCQVINPESNRCLMVWQMAGNLWQYCIVVVVVVLVAVENYCVAEFLDFARLCGVRLSHSGVKMCS